LESLAGAADTVVYVDSGSGDQSVEHAMRAGAHVLELDASRPFTAARARNAGFDRLLELAPSVEFVQFIDGDCTLRPGWIDAGVSALRARSDIAVACGRRRERSPEASVYNRLCDVEWDIPLGVVRACGGDALMRVDAFRRVGGFDDALIAGEEPDLCFRLSRLGYRVLRLDAEMSVHDAAMSRWTQWWKRAVRTGHTTADMLAKHGAAPEHRRARRALSALFWAVAVPCVCVAALAWSITRHDAIPVVVGSITAILAYAYLWSKIRRRYRAAGRSAADARAYAFSCLLAKVPETWGMLSSVVQRALGRTAHWIEYKDDHHPIAGADAS
jgi:hypothetical protein